MSEGYDDGDSGDSGGDPIAPSGALQAASQLSVTPSSTGGDYSGVVKQLNDATQRLKMQRAGLTPQQQISALLTGFGQPTQHRGWQSSVANAAAALQAQTLAKAKMDAQRDDLISKYDLMAAHYGAQNQASAARTAELAQAAKDKLGAPVKLNTEQVFRMGQARNYFPGVSDAEIVSRNLMYDPKVNGAVLEWKAASPLAASGDRIPAPAPPTLADFLAKARVANPGVSDTDLKVYYIKKYGGQ